MKKYTFDAENSLWYEQCGEYRLPCLTVPNSKMIGRWGQHHRRYDCGSFVVKGTAVAGKKQNNPYNRCKSTPKRADSYETLLEKMGGTYHQEGDYLIPNLSLPDEPEYRIGKYRRMCRMNSIRSCGEEIVLTELVYV